ncbi:hypothetical protein ABIB40_003145 [Pedobacter sp. UYP30]
MKGIDAVEKLTELYPKSFQHLQNLQDLDKNLIEKK